MDGFVLVGGWPGSGKTTLSRALAAELAIELLSKDEFKEELMDRMGAPATVEESRLLGRQQSKPLCEQPWVAVPRSSTARGIPTPYLW